MVKLVKLGRAAFVSGRGRRCEANEMQATTSVSRDKVSCMSTVKREGENLKVMIYIYLKTGSKHGQNLALTVSYVPYSFDSGQVTA